MCTCVCSCVCGGVPQVTCYGRQPRGKGEFFGLSHSWLRHSQSKNIFQNRPGCICHRTSCYPVAEEASPSCSLAGTPWGRKCWNLKGSLISSPQRLHGTLGEPEAQGHPAGEEQAWELRPSRLHPRFLCLPPRYTFCVPGHPSFVHSANVYQVPIKCHTPNWELRYR